MNSIKKYDDDKVPAVKEVQSLEQHNNDSHSATLQELGFGPEEEDEMQGLLNGFLNFVVIKN